MRTLTLTALLTPSLKPIRVWLINQRLRSSEREIAVIQMQRRQLEMEERQQHMRQVHLAAERRRITRT